MSFFQLDPASIAARARAAGTPRIPSLGQSLLIGIVGFTAVSVAGFVPWAAFGHLLGPWVGESGLYAICALVFIALSGPALHRLIIGPGSLSRFYQLFSIAFLVYSAIWIPVWMSLRGPRGSVWGLLGGTFAMGVILALAFDAGRRIATVVVALFLLNAAGYFIGGECEEWLFAYHELAAKLAWGVCYGIGFGAGLGVAFYLCQAEARRLLGARE
jgi:hypothetical protein